MSFLSKLFGRKDSAPAEPVAADPAIHPLLAMKAERDRLRRVGVGIVFAQDGRPRVSPDWVKNLNEGQREWVDKTLAARGWRINDQLEVEENI